MITESHTNESQAIARKSEGATGELLPREVVAQLDEYIIAQDRAKRAVALALRNRWRRLQVSEDLREEITPKNIIMIGPTGVGKTEISRRLARLVRAPFVKVEATKFTEVGYVGRDVDSIVRELVEVAVQLVREEEAEKNEHKAQQACEERLLDLLLPADSSDEARESGEADQPGASQRTREKLRELLRKGSLDQREVEVEISRQPGTQMQILGPGGFAEIEGQIKDMFSNMIPRQTVARKLKIPQARKVILEQEQEKLIDPEKLTERALQRAQQSGIVFIDEIDKVCARGPNTKGADVSREGVQRDLLPLVEGCTVSTKYGAVNTEHILFIASGAFHISKPSDLMPEFQGRFPIRVELESLSPEHFVRILTEPRNALTRQYQELMKTEGVDLQFQADGIEEIARLTADVNSRTENIGARRLHTVLERLLEDVSFEADRISGTKIVIDRAFVRSQLAELVQDSDLARYIL